MQPLWVPDERTTANSNICSSLNSLAFESYNQLYRWSVDEPEQFWTHVSEVLGIRFNDPPQRTLDLQNGPTAPHWFPGSRLNIAESCFQAAPDDLAIVYVDANGDLGKMSYRDVRKLANRVAHGLSRIGLVPGDAVAVFMPMTARSVSVYLGIILAGCVVVSVADSFSADQLRVRLQIGNAKAVFTQQSVCWGAKQFALYERVVNSNGPRAVLVDEPSPMNAPLRAGDLLWDDLLGDSNDRAVSSSADAPINILFSSGTTGEPKAIPWDHATPIKAASDGYFHHDIHPGDIVAWPTNLGWMMGPWLIFATMINRGTVALFSGPPLDEAFGKFVQDAGVTMLGVVPSMVRQWHQSGCMEELDWSQIRVFSSTGECSNPDDMRHLSQLAGGKPIIEYCGGTEIGGGYMTSTVVQSNYPSTFSSPALGSKFVVLDENDNPSNEGEVFLMPPALGLTQRLLNRNHHEVYFEGTPPGPHGELLRRHGDQVEVLSDGCFRSLGRADDSMNLGGIKISAAEMEQVLAVIPGIKEVAAIAAQPSAGGPSRLIICAVTEKPRSRDDKEIQSIMQQAIKKNLNPLFKIDQVKLFDQLPRTASNKIIRRRLREMC